MSNDQETDPQQRSTASVLVVEDNDQVAQLVVRVLHTSGFQVRAAASLAEARDALEETFDAAVLDVGLPDGSGFDIVQWLRQGYAPCAVVMMTGRPDGMTVTRSIEEGITEFLPKPFDARTLVASVNRALQTTREWRQRLGQRPAATAEEHALLQANGHVPADEIERIAKDLARSHGLTKRERQALELILLGFQNMEIARTLDISSNTVKYHVRNMLGKLELESRTELIALLVKK